MNTLLRSLTSSRLRTAMLLGLALGAGPSLSAQQAVVETFGPELNGGSGGVSVDAEGNVFVADFGAQLNGGGDLGFQLFRVSPAGEAEVFATGFRGASGNTFDSHGVLYQSNIGGNFLTRVMPDGSTERFDLDGLRSPVGIVFVGETGYVANCGANSILRFEADGASEIFVESDLLRCPNGITADVEGNLYVANFGNGDVVRIGADGSSSVLATIPGDNNGHLVHRDGMLYVVARAAHQIYRVSLDGELTLVAGSGERGRDDGPADQATFSFPNDLDFSPDGKYLYVNDVVPLEGPHTILAPMILRRITLP